jgi:hypothetical protein
MLQDTFVDSPLQYRGFSETWRERLPTFFGLTIVIGLVTKNLVVALSGSTISSLGIRMHRLGDGSYWVDSQSLGRVMRVIISGAGTN